MPSPPLRAGLQALECDSPSSLPSLVVTMAEGEGDSGDWLFDYMMSVFKAPTWEVPIMTFIDDNCIVFDSEDENKFAYTELHEVRGRGVWVCSV